MFKNIRTFCIKFPWLVVAAVLIITGGAVYQIKTNLYFEGDVTKFLPGDLKAVKANDYSQKNFNYQETVMVGIEYPAGSVLKPDVLRNIENIVLGLKELKATKTFNSKLTGKTETVTLPVGIDTEDINSIANLEDTILDRETGSVIAGSVIKKLKQDYRIASPEGMEERLPDTDRDLAKIIPALRERVMADRIFRGSVVSEDEQAANIQVPMIRKWDYKKRFAILELETALNPEKLKQRFQGNDSTFPFTVYGKTYDDVVYDDAFIQKHSAAVGKNLKNFLHSQFEPVFADHPELKKLIEGKKTSERLKGVMQYTADRDFFLDPRIRGWDQFMTDIYEFTLEVIDPLSRENLEFKFYDVRDIYNLKVNYELITDLALSYPMDGVTVHIAGQPVTIALISHMMSADMKRMLPIAIGVIFLMLILSFRNLAGLIIPLLTVVFSVIWTVGLMALTGTPLSISTTSMPIVLLAVGTAYGIHLLNRYFSDVRTAEERPAVIDNTFKQVGTAVVMAALTTMAGFGSIAFSSLPNLKHYGIFAAVGVFLALLLSFTLTPAILMLLKSGIKRKKSVGSDGSDVSPGKTGPVWPLFIMRRSKGVLALFGLITVLGILGAWNNYFEGDPIINFKKANPLYQADRFINKSLTGTNMVNLIFRFRDAVNLDNEEAAAELKRRVDAFADEWNAFAARIPELRTDPLGTVGNDLKTLVDVAKPDPMRIEQHLALVRDLLDEEYAVAGPEMQVSVEDAVEPAEEGDALSTDLGSLAAEDAGDDLGGLDDLGEEESTEAEETASFEGLGSDQVEGLNELARRLGVAETERTDTIRSIIVLRREKNKVAGLKMQRSFNLLQDFFAVDIKQPEVLHKLETLYTFLKELERPLVVKGGEELQPTGLVASPVDLVRKVYKTFYHDDNTAFDRLPDTTRDGFEDITLTDRSIIGVAINQALSSNRDMFDSMVTSDYKEFQLKIMIRSGKSKIIDEYVKTVYAKTQELFPEDDPYIERVLVGGLAPQLREVTGLLMDSQLKSIAGSFILVWLITFFIFRSAMGGLFSLIPLAFTVILNFGMMYGLGWPITQGTVIMASIAIGIGVDYTIHFMQRFKTQLQQGDTLEMAYVNTIRTSGKAIFINALSVALGFMVLVFSDFIPVISMGVLMMGTMLFSTTGALIILPALIYVIKPSFIKKANGEAVKEGLRAGALN
ncbi:MAG: MMPL family transporter [Proteobacteria bacterium]|nr:MMPL family transporter [Pseudomonadota bacterium]